MNLSCPFLTPKPVVDVRNPRDQDWLLWWLDVYEIRFSELDVVGWRIQGRPHTDLDGIVLAVKRARPEGFDPWDMAQDPPPPSTPQNRPQPARRPSGHGWRDQQRELGIPSRARASRGPAPATPPRATGAAASSSRDGAPTGTRTGSAKGRACPPW